jgi:isoleucyl-tRNA synthetase
LEHKGELTLDISGKSLILALTDVEISSQDIEGWLVASSGNITVALDITITPELKNEGIARELVNRIQNLRKDSGFDVTDKIIVKIATEKSVDEAIKGFGQYIKEETLTQDLVITDSIENGTDIEFDDIKTTVLISK